METPSPARRPGSIRDIVRAKLGVGEVFKPTEECALYDVSGSMSSTSKEPGKTMWDMLVELDAELPSVRKFAFNNWVKEILPGERIPLPGGGTALTETLQEVKKQGVRHVILITDGKPNSPQTALTEAAGLKIDVIYVGPPPEPGFLKDLARVTGGSYGHWNISEPKKLASGVKGLLAAPAEEKKGAIQL